jgi:hypothetical protein
MCTVYGKTIIEFQILKLKHKNIYKDLNKVSLKMN